MFQIPEWDDNVPDTNLSFNQNNVKRNKKHSSKETSVPQENGEKLKQNNKISGKKKNKLKPPKDNVASNIGKYVKNINNGDIKSKSHNNKPLNGAIQSSKIVENGLKNKNNTEKVANVKSDSKKRKLSNTKSDMNESFEPDLNTDKLDEVIIDVKKRKLKKFNNKEEKDIEEMFVQNSKSLNKKKEAIKRMLEKTSNRNVIKVNGNSLRERMLQRLKAAQFRYINEKLYTSSGSDAKQLFQQDPTAFHTYHQGYQQQVKKWPVNPLDVIVQRIMKMPQTHLIADMGCGEAVLSQRIPHKVRSFDLVAVNSNVEVCDIAHTPLLASSVDVAVYCLALMGTDLTQYLVEANRVLKKGGYLLIAEVESRFDKVEDFTNEVQKLGFSLKNLDKSNQVFYFMEFVKVQEPPKKSKQPHLTLKPCLYKKR